MVLRSDSWAEHCRTFNRHGGIGGLTAEIDALRGEKAEWVKVFDDMVLVQQRTEAERDALRTEVERLRAVEQAARAYCGVPIDDPDAGALYRAVCEALRRPTHDE